MKLGLLGVLQVIFIVLKLAEITQVATWSWWLVLLPTFIGVGFWLLIALIAIIGLYFDSKF